MTTDAAGQHARSVGRTAAMPLHEGCEQIMVGIASAATHAYRPAGVPLIRNTNIKEGRIEADKLIYLDPEYEQQHRRKRLKSGDVIVVRTGNPGIAAVVPPALEGAQCFTSLIIRPKKEILDPDYLCIYINAPPGQRQFMLGAAGGAQKNVNAATLSRMMVPVPGIELQKAIAAGSEALSRWLRATRELAKAKGTFRRGLMQQLLTGQRRFPEFVGQPWVMQTLSEFFTEKATVNTTRNVSLVYSCTKTSGIVPQKQRFAKRLASIDLGRYKVVSPGDLVYDPMLLWDGSIGFVPSTEAGVVSPAYETFSVSPTANRDYLWALLKSPTLVQRYKKISQGTNTRRQKAHPRHFLKLTVPMPPSREEQDKVGQVLTAAQREIDLLSAEAEQIVLLRRDWLLRMLSGELTAAS